MARAGPVASTSEDREPHSLTYPSRPRSPYSARNNAGPLVGHLGGRALRDACGAQGTWSMALELGACTAQACEPTPARDQASVQGHTGPGRCAGTWLQPRLGGRNRMDTQPMNQSPTQGHVSIPRHAPAVRRYCDLFWGPVRDVWPLRDRPGAPRVGSRT